MKKKSEIEEPCTACKVTAVCCLFGISAYLIYQGRMQNKQSRFSLYALGTGSTTKHFSKTTIH